ncbi:DUF1552 domain-containing protein [Bryobacter aggregatus]|uniref:DUF1552 domain-containing protein n=1 Tax=Bryobacter aggregatus TaxID=360054 RepID=UPI0004E152AF|nr:DUF1552 domain-containing protein [Bryobacter aggregatus]
MAKPISRRMVLRGVGAAMSLPWLESFAKAQENLTEPPLRTAFVFMPNGVRPDHWTPPGDSENFELTPHLQPLAGLKSDILLIENLWHKNTVGRNGHWPKVPAWLSGGFVERTVGSDLDAGGTTIDQLAARHIGSTTPLPSFELGIDAPRTGIDTAGGGFPRALGSFLSWADPHTPVPKEIVPQVAFDRLFRNRVSAAVASDETSVLDAVLDQAKSLRRRGSTSDQARLDEYFESVRSLERRIEASQRPQKRWINKGKLPVDRPPAGIPATHAEHLRMMLDILVLAFWTDSTRIASMMMGDAQSAQDYGFLPGVKGNWHSISHHREIEENKLQYQKIINWNMEQFAYFLNRLKNLDEGGKSLLDNSMILFGGSLKDGNSHQEEDLPILLAGSGKGWLKTGRRIRAAKKTPLCNLHLAMLHRMGIDQPSFGDSTGPLQGLA